VEHDGENAVGPGPRERGLGRGQNNDTASKEVRSGSPPSRKRARQRSRGHGRFDRGADCDGPFYAALDLGTNNCRLLVAHPTRRAFRVVDSFSRIVRLGEGVSRQGRLGEEAMHRAVEALAVCREKIVSRRVVRRRLIATEACRIAENGEEFIERVRERTGMELEIVSRETEARLAVSGCASLVDPDARGVIVFDIGGGSTELIWLDFGEERWPGALNVQRHVSAWASLPLGVVTIAERFGGREVTRLLFEEMCDFVRTELATFPGRDAMSAALASGRVHLLGTSGTVTTICGVHLGLDRYDRRRVDGTWMRDTDVVGVTDRLIAMSYDERVGNPCIGADRADLVLAGCAIFEAIRREWPCERIRVADRGLREGILLTLMAQDGVWRRQRRHPGMNAPRSRGAET
jgi:exopolyphosphatase / guanosine-5'-triphosphate,3'-diphosphate pyrophosphatase